MKKKIKKFKISKEEKGIFIAIGIIILVAIGILLTWYFTRDKEEPEKEPDQKVVVDYSKWEIPDVLTTVYVGQRIEFITTIIFNEKEETADVGIQKLIDEKWINITTTDNEFTPEEIGLYRYVYTFKGVEKTKNFNVIELPVASWSIPQLSSRIALGRELTLNPIVFSGGERRLATVSVQVRNQSGKWVDVTTVNAKFTPILGAYRYVYVYNCEIKYHNFTVIDWGFEGVALNNIRVGRTYNEINGVFPISKVLQSLGETPDKINLYDATGQIVNVNIPLQVGTHTLTYYIGKIARSLSFEVLDTFNINAAYEIDLATQGANPVLLENANKVSTNYNTDRDRIEIDVFGKLNPQNKMIGVITEFNFTEAIVSIQPQGSMYIFDEDIINEWTTTSLGQGVERVLFWLNFNGNFDEEIDVELKITLDDGTIEHAIVTFVFRDFLVEAGGPDNVRPEDQIVEADVNDDVELKFAKVDPRILSINIIHGDPAKNIVGLLVALNGQEGTVTDDDHIVHWRKEGDKLIIWLDLAELDTSVPKPIVIALDGGPETITFSVIANEKT